jgi:Secretion system C-terminal sorting domain
MKLKVLNILFLYVCFWTNAQNEQKTTEPNYLLANIEQPVGTQNSSQRLANGCTLNEFAVNYLGFEKYLFNTSQAYQNIYWFINDSLCSRTSILEHQFNQNGTYKVKLKLENKEGCIDSVSKNIIVTDVLLTLVSDILSDGIEVYPVPTKDKLNIEIPDNIPAGVYATITNLIGVDTGEKYGLKDGKNVIDVSSFSNGIYFLNIYIGVKVLKFKFIVA